MPKAEKQTATHQPPQEMATTRRLTDLDKKALAPYFQAIGQAQQAANAAFVTLLAGKGIDADEWVCQITPDGEAFVMTRRQGADEAPQGAPSDAKQAAREALRLVKGEKPKDAG